MKRFGWCVALCVVALFLGCDQGGGSSKQKATPPSADNAKAALADVAKTGTLGSGMMTVESYIGTLRASDPTKANGLANDMTELRSLGSKPDAMKAKAKAMADKL